jgi:tetratricopeptide (TPR) repeat protein
MNHDTNNPEAMRVITLAGLQLEQGNPTRALETLDRAQGGVLEIPSYWFHRAWALNDLKRYQEGAMAAQKGLALNPDNVWMLFILALNQEKLDKLADAEISVLNALRLAPENPLLLTYYANLVAKAGQWDKAERLQAEAERIDPTNSIVVRNRTKLAFIRGDTKTAVSGARTMLANDPEDTFAHYVTGHMAAEQGAYGEAEKRFTTAARQNPGNSTVTSAVRQTRYLRHPLLIPLYPIERFGAIPLWLGFIVAVYGLQAIGQTQLATIVSVFYLLYCVYSWVVPRALKWYLERKRRG